MKTDITMFADASVSDQTKTSGWGFWIKGDGRDSMHAGGPLRVFSPSTAVAELEAIANGLACASGAEYFRETDKTILIQSDSTQALACIMARRRTTQVSPHATSAPIQAKKKRLQEREAAAVTHILDVVDRHNLMIVVRHVRGHKHGDGRNWVNRLCDRLAKEGRKKAEALV